MRVSASIAASCTLTLILLGQPVGSQTAVPVGDQFQVNTYTLSDQERPAVGFDDEGNFVVVWDSSGSWGSDSSGPSVQVRVYTSIGVPIGPEVQINTYTILEQEVPAVAFDTDGDFVVVWQSQGSGDDDSSSFSIQGQRYDSDAQTAGGEFQVNSYTSSRQESAAVATDPYGNFIVVWDSDGSYESDTSNRSIQGKRYDSIGDLVEDDFQVNTYTTSFQQDPAVGMNADGAFVVVWESQGSGGSDSWGWSIQGRIYDSTGEPIGPQGQVNTYTTGSQKSPAVGVNDEGEFVVVWESHGSGGSDDSGYSIQGRIYTSTGLPVGPQAQINTYTTDDQRSPAVGVDADGNFVVVWESLESGGSDNDGSSIQGRLYGSNAVPAGGDFQINSYTTGGQSHPAVGFDDRGRFVVVWDSFGSSESDTSSYSIQGQVFAIAIFADGFESGNTTVWSSSVP